MTRHGKIARLPAALREELNRRLHEGEAGVHLVDWLNGLPEVRQVLAAHFGGRPLSEQNLSEWKQGGFEDWRRHQDDLDWLHRLREESTDFVQAAGESTVADWLSAPLALALGRLLRSLEPESLAEPARLRGLLAATEGIIRLRRTDQEEQWLKLERARWHAEEAEAERERKSNQAMAPVCAMFLSRMMKDFAGEELADGSEGLP